MKAMRVLPLLSAISLSISPALGQYHVGDKVQFNDRNYKYGGGWVDATVTQDYGPSAVEQWIVQIDGKSNYYQEHARQGDLRPRGGAQPAIQTSKDGPSWQAQQLNGWRTPDTPQLPAGARPPAAQDPAAKAESLRQQAAALEAQAAQLEAAAHGAVAPGAGQLPPPLVPPQPGQAINPQPAAIGNGKFPSRVPLKVGQTNVRTGKDGQQHIIAVAEPGVESPIGRWFLNSGGVFSKEKEEETPNARVITYDWSIPAHSDVLLVKPDGTWVKQFAGRQTTGRWLDLGQNVVQLVGFEDGDDWTGSVLKRATGAPYMYLKSPVGMYEYGQRR